MLEVVTGALVGGIAAALGSVAITFIQNKIGKNNELRSRQREVVVEFLKYKAVVMNMKTTNEDNKKFTKVFNRISAHFHSDEVFEAIKSFIESNAKDEQYKNAYKIYCAMIKEIGDKPMSRYYFGSTFTRKNKSAKIL